MSEGPEVKIIADKISSLLKGKEIEDILFKIWIAISKIKS
jgi:hypothetical protein